MRIAFDELVPDGEEIVRLRLAWSRMEADHVGSVLEAHGFDYAEEEAEEGWAIYVSRSDAPRALDLLHRRGVDSTEAVYNAGL